MPDYIGFILSIYDSKFWSVILLRDYASKIQGKVCGVWLRHFKPKGYKKRIQLRIQKSIYADHVRLSVLEPRSDVESPWSNIALLNRLIYLSEIWSKPQINFLNL